MPRRSRRTTSQSSENEPGAIASGASSTVNDSPGVDAATQPTEAETRGERRRRVMREVAERRAAFFARGGREEDDENQDGEMDTSGLRNSSTPMQSWPGRMSTARDLLKKRAAVKRRREAGDAPTAEADEVGGGPSDASSSEADDLVSVHGDSDSDDRAAKAPRGEEAAASPGGGSGEGAAKHRAIVVSKEQRAHWKRRYDITPAEWRPAATQHSNNPFVPATASSHPHLKQRRRPHSLVSGDGFALVEEVFSVPPLTVLCLKSMQQDLPTLGGSSIGLLPPALRHSLVYSTAAARQLDSSTCQVFAPLRASRGDEGCDEEGGAPVAVEDTLELPDCSSIDDATLRETLAMCGGHLYALHLRHCGRCFTDKTVHWLTHSGPGSLAELQGSPPGRVFASLRRLHLEGAYSLSNTGLRSLLQAAENLQSLSLHASPDIDGGALQELSSVCPSLQSLTLSACHKVGDVALGVRFAKVGGGATEFKTSDEEVTPTDAMLLPYQVTHTQQAPLPKGFALHLGGSGIGLVAASHIVHLELSHLPNVTDALFDSLVAAAGGQLPLSSLVLRQMPGITNHSMHLLGGRSMPREGPAATTAYTVEPLASPSLPPPAAHLRVLVLDTLPNVSDTGVRSVARCLRGDALRMGVVNMHSVRKEPSILRLLRAASGSGALLPCDAPPASDTKQAEDTAAGADGMSNSMAAMLAALSDSAAAADAKAEEQAAEGGTGLARLQLSGVACLSDATLSMLARSSAVLSLRHLDLSWCRGVSDTGVGMLADACQRLLTLRLWGNTQLTNELYTRLRSAKLGSAGDDVCSLYIEGRPGDKLPPPEFELPARAGGSETHLYEVSALP